MIEQKAAELLFSLPPDRRKLADLRLGISHATHAQKYVLLVFCQIMYSTFAGRLFASLASDTARPLPYSQDIAQNRFKYGESMLRRSAEHLAAQDQYEADARARMDVARRQRQEEKVRLDEEQQRKQSEEQRKADELAQRRRELREKTEVWATARRAESDEEDEKRADKARKAAARKSRQEANASGEENVDGGKKERKRRRTKAPRKRRDDGQEDESRFADGLPDGAIDEDEAIFSGDDANGAMDDDAPDRPKKVCVSLSFHVMVRS